MIYLSKEITEELIRKRLEHLKANSVLDNLWRMKMQGDMAMVINSLQVKVDEYVKNNPEKDVVDQQVLIEYMEEIQRWMNLVWDEAITLDKFNTYLTKILLDKEIGLNAKIKKLDDEMIILKDKIE